MLASLPNAAEPRQVPRSLGKFPALTLLAASVAQAEPATSRPSPQNCGIGEEHLDL